jgi:hypothetical protein
MRYLYAIVFALLAGFFTYSAYQEYQNYEIVKKSDKTIIWIDMLNQVLDHVGVERSHSAIYLGYKGKTDFSMLEGLRQKTDIVIADVKSFISYTPEFSIKTEKLSKLISSLQYARSRVDVISEDYNSVLFSYYQKEVIDILVNEIKESSSELSKGFENLKEYFFEYVDFLKYKNNIDKERSFIAYILSLSQKMKIVDLKLWDNILESDITPKFRDLDGKIVLKLKTFLETVDSSKQLSNHRLQIAQGLGKGNFQLSVSTWFDTMAQKIKSVKDGENILYNHYKKEIEGNILTRKWIITHIVGAILSFILSIMFIFVKRKDKHRRKEDVVKKAISADDMIEVVDTKKVVQNSIKTEIETEVKEVKTENIPNFQKTKVSIPSYKQLVSNGNEIELFNTNEVLSSTVEPFGHKAYDKNVKFEYYIDPTVPAFCMGNISKIRQILMLLVDHAIEETSSGGFVSVNIEKTAENKLQSAIEFSVIDSGGYISKRLKNKVENAFHSVGKSGEIVFGDRDTDLLFVGKTISKLGGAYEIKSKSKSGSTFSFTLSLKKA